MGKNVSKCSVCKRKWDPNYFLKSSPTSWRSKCRECFNYSRRKYKNGKIDLYAGILLDIKNSKK